MRKGSAATWNPCRHTPGNFWSGWKNPTWMKFPESPRRERFARKTPRAILGRRWQLPRKFTITCDYFSRAADRRFASSAERKFARILRMRLRERYCRRETAQILRFVSVANCVAAV